jgi:hypothetical protein
VCAHISISTCSSLLFFMWKQQQPQQQAGIVMRRLAAVLMMIVSMWSPQLPTATAAFSSPVSTLNSSLENNRRHVSSRIRRHCDHYHHRPALRPSSSFVSRSSSSSSRSRSRDVVLRDSPMPSPPSTAEQQLPRNEFSRPVQPDRVVGRGGGSRNRRSYDLSIVATAEECRALARRFDLPDLASLSADLSLRSSSSAAASAAAFGIEVSGMCRAVVTHRCVRTNELFKVDVELPLYSMVRPVVPASATFPILSVLRRQPAAAEVDEAIDSANGGGGSSSSREDQPPLRRSTSGQTTTASVRPPNRNLDDIDVMELQRMLQNVEDDDDSVMEDEAIYAVDGVLDVGELVSQLFYLSLDPYPKKPGSGPVQYSITG